MVDLEDDCIRTYSKFKGGVYNNGNIIFIYKGNKEEVIFSGQIIEQINLLIFFKTERLTE